MVFNIKAWDFIRIAFLALAFCSGISCGAPRTGEVIESNDSSRIEPTPGSGESSESESEENRPSEPEVSNENDAPTDEPSSDETEVPSEPLEIDPYSPGPYEVLEENGISLPGADGRMAEARLCSPAAPGEERIAEGEFPLVFIFPGFQLNRDQYTSYCEFMASWGIITLAITYSESGFGIDHEHLAQDVPVMIDWATSAEQTIAESIDANSIGVAGHSLGGKIAIMAASLDSRIGVVLGWDPVEGMGATVIPQGVAQIDAPLLLIGETLDAQGLFQACAPEDGNYARFYEAAPNIALEITVHGADHMDWVDDPSCWVCILCKSGELDHGDVKAFTRRTTLAFVRRYLLGDESMERYLTGSVMQADEQSGLVSIQSKGL